MVGGVLPGLPAPPDGCGGVEPGGGGGPGRALPLPGLLPGGPPIGGCPPPELLDPARPPPGCALPDGLEWSPAPDPVPPLPEPSGGPPPPDVLGLVWRGLHCTGYVDGWTVALLGCMGAGGGGGGGILRDGTIPGLEVHRRTIRTLLLLIL